MELYDFFKFEGSLIPADKIFLLTEELLSEAYSGLDEVERMNIFFHLQNELFFLKENGKTKEAAYVCYLISYYIFVPLTPPHSEVLAMHYAKLAIELCREEKYLDWLQLVQNGN